MSKPAWGKAASVILVFFVALGVSPESAGAQSLWQKLKQQMKQAEEQAKQQQQQQRQVQPQAGQPGSRNNPGRQAQASYGGNPGAGGFTPPPGTKVEEQFLAPAQSGAKFVIGPHGVNVATLENAGSREVVYYNGVEGPRFDEILTEAPAWYGGGQLQVVFSPDGKRFAYCGRSGNQFVIMADGKELARGSDTQDGQINGRSCELGFTPDSQHVFYKTLFSKMSNGRTLSYVRFVFDGKAAPLVMPTQSGAISPVLSPDNNHYAFLAADPADLQKLELVIDGRMAPYVAGDLQWSPDSRHLYSVYIHNVPGRGRVEEGLLDGRPFIRAEGLKLHIPPAGNMVVAVVGANRGVAHFLVIEGRKIPGSEVDGAGAHIDMVTFSPDGKHYAARLSDAQNRQYVFADGRRGAEYQNVDHIAFTADSSKVVYTAYANGKTFVVYGGQESDPCQPDITEGIVLPTQGSSAGALCVGGSPMIFVNGKTTPIIGVGARHLSFTPDGQHYVYVSDTHGTRQLVIDGVVQKAARVASEDAPSITQYVISPDGEHMAAFASGQGPAGPYSTGVFVDGKFIPIDTTSMFYRIAFTPDSKHLVWAENARSMSGAAAVRVFVDGKSVAQVETALGPASPEHWWDVASDGTVSVLGQDGKGLKRINITPSPSTSVDTLLAEAH